VPCDDRAVRPGWRQAGRLARPRAIL